MDFTAFLVSIVGTIVVAFMSVVAALAWTGSLKLYFRK